MSPTMGSNYEKHGVGLKSSSHGLKKMTSLPQNHGTYSKTFL
jgi:hypothetical protein